MTEGLDLTSLSRAAQKLGEGLERYQRNTADEQVRDGLIQRFKFTYEVSHKILKRYLELVSATPEIYDAMPFADIIRSGNEQGLLLNDWSRWKFYRDMRARTSHTYNEIVALEVVSSIPAILADARYLLARLEERLQR
jgi:nucleotidyltransferase substrate binding protein (TIGR01987 family)